MNLSKIRESKCQVLHLGKNNPMHQYKVLDDWLESSFAAEDLGILEGTKMNIRQQCVIVAKAANSLLGFIRQSIYRYKEVILPIYAGLLRSSRGEVHGVVYVNSPQYQFQ